MKKSELRQMIREVLREEFSIKKLTESDDAAAKRIQEIRAQIRTLESELASLTSSTKYNSIPEKKTEADYDNVMKQIKADLIREIKPTPTVELNDEFIGEKFKDIDITWNQWNLDDLWVPGYLDTFEYEDGDNSEFEKAYDSVVSWIDRNKDRYEGFELKRFEVSSASSYYTPFITINVRSK